MYKNAYKTYKYKFIFCRENMGFNKFVIDTTALKYNVSKLKKMIGSRVKLCGVVKAEAYSHGGVIVANAIKDDCDFFAVACVKEAMELRDRKIENNILILGIIPNSDLKYCIFNNISICLSSISQLYDILSTLKQLNLGDNDCLKIHLKINTGLNRLGISKLSEFKKILKLLESSRNIVLEGIFTHFATKSNDNEFVIEQYNTFKKFTSLVDNNRIIIHCNNSYATTRFPEYFNSMVRCGFLMYGGISGYKPVLNIATQIVNLNQVENGSIGYDRTIWVRDRLIAVIPIGYADGFDRRLSNNFRVLVNGEYANVVGNICMDMCMIDVTDIPDVEIGTKVTLLGEDGDKAISINDYADALGTSPYEVLLKFDSRRMDIIEL